MNEKELMRKAITRMEKSIKNQISKCVALVIWGLILSMICGGLMILHGSLLTILGILIAIAIGASLGLEVRYTLRRVSFEANRLWEFMYISYSRVETTLDAILYALEDGEDAENIIEFVGKKRRESIIDDLALEKLQEREAEHIPSI